ncbi:Alpha/Beta hydrolase protein [Trichoderma barbatum]
MPMMAAQPYPEPTVCAIVGATCIRTSSKTPAEWPGKDKVAQMHVECLEPMVVRYKDPIVLIHGDFHHGFLWLTKPDGKAGWAACFLNRGYRVFIVDLPGCGQSDIPLDYNLCSDFMVAEKRMNETAVESQLTAPEKHMVGGSTAWPTAGLHNKWPGTGQRGDPVFNLYMKSQQALFLQKAVRQKLAQSGLCSLLKIIGKSVLIGQGAGCTVAWLAADAMPELVAKVVSIEPAGPPAARAHINHPEGRRYSSWLSRDDGVRKYGLSDVALTFSPPAKDTTEGPVLDLEVRQHPNNLGCYMAQKYVPGCVTPTKPGQESVPQLVQLKQMRHAVFTAEASSHRMFDWATVTFMRQAGVSVDHFDLAQFGVNGNGHLMFLETNSDDIAAMVAHWIETPDEEPTPVGQGKDKDKVQDQVQVQVSPKAMAPSVAPKGASKRRRRQDDDGNDLPTPKRLDTGGLQSPPQTHIKGPPTTPQHSLPMPLLQHNASYPSPECEALPLEESAPLAEQTEVESYGEVLLPFNGSSDMVYLVKI